MAPFAAPPFAAPVWAVPRGTEGVRIMTQAVTESMSVAECLAGTGLAESDLADEDTEIWAHQEFTVVRNIIDALGGQPGRGIEVGGFSTLGRTGMLGFAFLTSATVREGLERALPYLALAPSHMRLSVEADDEHDYLAADDSDIPADIRPFIVERDVGGLAAVLRGANVCLEPDWLETTRCALSFLPECGRRPLRSGRISRATGSPSGRERSIRHCRRRIRTPPE